VAQFRSIDDLTKLKCVPCSGEGAKLGRNQASELLKALPGWKRTADGRLIWKEWLMKDFVSAVELIGRIKTVAEPDDHHPDLHLTAYRRLKVELSTHAIGGLSENDFIVAAKIEKLPKDLKAG
jgi:4a-hydroxytetrahydrobiopterin dehydratase